MLFTAQLVITVYFLAVEKHRATFLAPIGIGASLFIGHIASINLTGASMNPARTFGPSVITSFSTYHWVYWIGPLAGALLAYVVYSTLKWLDYKAANPGQDEDDIERLPDKLTVVKREDGEDGRPPPSDSVGNIQSDQLDVIKAARD